MIEIFGRKMRLVFQQPSSPRPDAQSRAAAGPMIQFSAWAEDCRLSGLLALEGDRLSDMLNLYDDLELIDVLAQGLDGGPVMEIAELSLTRDEILLVEASGPRGNPGRRRHMRPVPISVQLGEFGLRGNVHVTPGADPIVALSRRPPMVALTDAQLSFRGVPQPLSEAVDSTVLFNWHLVTSIDVGNRHLPRLKDLTGAA
ncbi:MAG: hypothetical protein ABI628_10620 [Chloroflexota bacterium]